MIDPLGTCAPFTKSQQNAVPLLYHINYGYTFIPIDYTFTVN